ncbi:hypothetical protein AK812_SmicGene43142 [Symbiodinium microadriaticum]|uniref:Uncharacterized protein n=1 Tax=Symbiodinium microadriaticum TaxID=2951 RepID=A0A1Q9C1T0_SYMMI|nr:hypothetical protein AK812_SmicGene43142 [Symbiodinium microadriaticum]CAE7338089.1 unnamed protein product [Symbiodinium microadriaticum]CAE7339740.1 unnamed protein product [Symbiodinium sp. KB8]
MCSFGHLCSIPGRWPDIKLSKQPSFPLLRYAKTADYSSIFGALIVVVAMSEKESLDQLLRRFLSQKATTGFRVAADPQGNPVLVRVGSDGTCDLLWVKSGAWGLHLGGKRYGGSKAEELRIVRELYGEVQQQAARGACQAEADSLEEDLLRRMQEPLEDTPQARL